MAQPPFYPEAPQLYDSTELYTQRPRAGEGQVNQRFSLAAIYSFFRATFGFHTALRHEQTTASQTWVVSHGFPVRPTVQCFTSIQEVVGGASRTVDVALTGQVAHLSDSLLEVRFNSSRDGFAVLNA